MSCCATKNGFSKCIFLGLIIQFFLCIATTLQVVALLYIRISWGWFGILALISVMVSHSWWIDQTSLRWLNIFLLTTAERLQYSTEDVNIQGSSTIQVSTYIVSFKFNIMLFFNCVFLRSSGQPSFQSNCSRHDVLPSLSTHFRQKNPFVRMIYWQKYRQAFTLHRNIR